MPSLFRVMAACFVGAAVPSSAAQQAADVHADSKLVPSAKMPVRREQKGHKEQARHKGSHSNVDIPFSEQEIATAVAAEAEAAASAEGAVERTVQDMETKANDVFVDAKAKIDAIVGRSRVDIAKTKSEVQRAVEKLRRASSQVRAEILSDATTATSHLKALLSYDHMSQAGKYADKVAATAMLGAQALRAEIMGVKGTAAKAVEDTHASAVKASLDVQLSASKAVGDLDAMAKQLQEVGAHASSELKAENSSATIASKTMFNAGALREKASLLDEAAKSAAMNLEDADKQGQREINAMASQAEDEENAYADVVDRAGLEAKQEQTEAKATWVMASDETIEDLKHAATAQTSITTQKTQQTSPTKLKSSTALIAVFAVILAGFVSIAIAGVWKLKIRK